jgi:eukaryotic-like serine/threonine-protein kinase
MSMIAEPSGIGRFELGSPIGSGGMGTVFEARDRKTGERLAIKALHDGAGAVLYQFKREFRVLSELSHPFLVRFGELFEDAGRFYLTMELVDGENFLDHVRPGSSRSWIDADAMQHDGILDVERLRHAIGQLASALIALHASGIVHRDVKPQNVLVASDGRLVLLDFGLAVSDEERVQRPELAGTVPYMAPEQIAGLTITQATDWYAVGVVLYQSLTGRLPHAGVPLWSSARRTRPPAPVSVAEGGDLPADLCALCMGLLEPQPPQRLAEEEIAKRLGLDTDAERGRASFRSQLHFSRTVFVNRKKELDLLGDALSRARRDGCRIVRIVGESGVGKTALLRRWLSEAGAEPDGAVVLSSRCYERETLPYRGVDGVVDALARHLGDAEYGQRAIPVPSDAALLGQVFPVLRGVAGFEGPTVPDLVRQDPQEARRLAFSALRHLLTKLTEEQPLVVHVDDAQWIDPESIALLSFLVLGDVAPRMLLVLTERPTGTSALAGLTESTRGAMSFELRRLDAAESELMARELLRRRGGDDGLIPAAVAETSGGHPLFIHELVLHHQPGARAGASLEAALSARIARLEPECRRLLDFIALASRPLAHDVAQAAADLAPAQYPHVLATLRSENLATFQGLTAKSEVHVYHDRIRELVIEAMSGHLLKERHLLLASSIEALSPGELDALAYHFFEGGVRDKAARYARGAAERALEKLAFEHAARFFELALRAESDPDTLVDLEEQFGDALANAGRGVDAAEAYVRASAHAEVTRAKELRRRAGEQLLRAGHVENGIAILSRILRELGVRVPKTDLETAYSLTRALMRLHVRLYFRGLRFSPRPVAEITPEERLRLDACWTVATGLSMVHHLRATDFQARSLLLALDVGDRERVLKAAALLSTALSADPIVRPIAERLMEGARELGDSAPSAENRAWLTLTTGAAAMGNWDFAKCIEACGRAEAEFRDGCTGVAWEVVTSQAFMLWSMAFEGQLKSAGGRLPDLLASARARGDRHALATLVLSPLHLVGLAADEPSRVRADCEATVREWPEDFACFQHMCAAYVMAQADLYEARADEAWVHVLRAWRMLRRSHLSRVQFQRIDLLGLRARAAVASALVGGRVRRDWLRRARADAERLRRVKIDAAVGMAELVEGAALRAEGLPAEAAGRFIRACAHFESRGMLLHSAVARLAGGIVTNDASARDVADRELGRLGVTNRPRMLQLWVPGIGP